MKSEVKSINLISPNDWNYVPEKPDEFYLAAEALIGIKGEIGSDIFSFEICTPLWLEKNRGKSPSFIRHILLVNEFDSKAIKAAVVALAENISGDNWDEIASKLSRYMFWEFEDYQPYEPKT